MSNNTHGNWRNLQLPLKCVYINNKVCYLLSIWDKIFITKALKWIHTHFKSSSNNFFVFYVHCKKVDIILHIKVTLKMNLTFQNVYGNRKYKFRVERNDIVCSNSMTHGKICILKCQSCKNVASMTWFQLPKWKVPFYYVYFCIDQLIVERKILHL